MYAYIKGTLAEVGAGAVVIEAGGIGYNISVPARLMDMSLQIGSELKLYTYLNVREDAMQLFGFMTKDELEMFRQLINVSGIGPRGGISILSVLSPREIRLAVLNNDSKTIAGAPGIGAKTAQKVIIELKDKIDDEDLLLDLTGVEEAAAAGSVKNQAERDAIDALIALGYSASDARLAVQGAGSTEDDDTQTILRKALKNMAML